MISWGAKQQKTVALSTAEAEYMAISDAGKEALWLRNLYSTLHYKQQKATTIWEDNKSCILLTKHNKFHARSKHIDIKYHHIREQVESGTLIVRYKPTEEMSADIFTKALGRAKFEGHRKSLGLRYFSSIN